MAGPSELVSGGLLTADAALLYINATADCYVGERLCRRSQRGIALLTGEAGVTPSEF